MSATILQFPDRGRGLLIPFPQQRNTATPPVCRACRGQRYIECGLPDGRGGTIQTGAVSCKACGDTGREEVALYALPGGKPGFVPDSWIERGCCDDELYYDAEEALDEAAADAALEARWDRKHESDDAA